MQLSTSLYCTVLYSEGMGKVFSQSDCGPDNATRTTTASSYCQGFGLPGGFAGGGVTDTDTGSNFATRYKSLPDSGYYGSQTSVSCRTTRTTRANTLQYMDLGPKFYSKPRIVSPTSPARMTLATTLMWVARCNEYIFARELKLAALVLSSQSFAFALVQLLACHLQIPPLRPTPAWLKVPVSAVLQNASQRTVIRLSGRRQESSLPVGTSNHLRK